MNYLSSFNQFLSDVQIELNDYYDLTVQLLPKLLVGLLLLVCWLLVSKRIKKTLTFQLSKRSEDPLTVKFIGRIVFIILATIGVLFFLKIIGLGGIATGILGTAGVSAFIIGFAFKDIGEHFLAGFVLAFNRPFRVGDLVELAGQKGKVIGLNIRDTHLKTFDGKDLYVPNGNIIKNTLVNYTIDGFLRLQFTLGLDYGSDIPEAIRVILDELTQIPGILKDEKKPSVAIGELGASALNLVVYYWIDTFDSRVNGVQLRIDAIKRVLTALEKAGFYLPGNIVELKNYSSAQLSVAGSMPPIN